jgi:hypothetical protein
LKFTRRQRTEKKGLTTGTDKTNRRKTRRPRPWPNKSQTWCEPRRRNYDDIWETRVAKSTISDARCNGLPKATFRQRCEFLIAGVDNTQVRRSRSVSKQVSKVQSGMRRHFWVARAHRGFVRDCGAVEITLLLEKQAQLQVRESPSGRLLPRLSDGPGLGCRHWA